jgi:hypothetical protein
MSMQEIKPPSTSVPLAADKGRTSEGPEPKPTLIEQVVPWLVLVGGGAFAACYLYGAALSMMYDPRLYQIALANFPVTVGLPFVALAALALVVFLGSTSGPIEFEAIGFKFKGAAGPIVMWILCFLSMVIAVHLLWRS